MEDHPMPWWNWLSGHRLCHGLFWVVLSVQPVMATDPPGEIDPEYGQVLYAWFQEDYFDALTRLQPCLDEAIAADPPPCVLLAAGAYLNAGMPGEAERLVSRVQAHLPAQKRALGHFYLGKARSGQGRQAEAMAHWMHPDLTHHETVLPEAVREELGFRRGDAALLLALPDAQSIAAATYAGMRSDFLWKWHLGYHLAVHQYRAGHLAEAATTAREVLQGLEPWPARGHRIQADGAIRLAEETGVPFSGLDVLRDRARRLLAVVALEQGNVADSLAQFGALSPYQPSPPELVMALTRLLEEQEGPVQALAFLEALKSQGLLPTTPSLVFWMGYLKERSGQPALANADYEAVTRQVDARVTHWQDYITSLSGPAFRENELIRLSASVGSDQPGFWADDVLLSDERLAQLLEQYRELRQLAARAQDWQARLVLFRAVLDERQRRWEARRPLVRRHLEQDPGGRLRARLEELLARYPAIREEGHSVVPLLGNEERARWQRLDEASQRLKRLAGQSFYPEEQRQAVAGKLAFFRRLLEWRASEQAPKVRWMHQREVRKIHQQLQGHAMLEQRLQQRLALPEKIPHLSHRVAHQTRKVEAFIGRVKTETGHLSTISGQRMQVVATQHIEVLRRWKREALLGQARLADPTRPPARSGERP